ncbi:endonuclease/exonuclease/phosphatase family protein [Serratia aquatilis]|uniref:Endonuclease/exonuclease/phosphatase family protein n=1 Tax=Serratia aquatilis TaxID=1737515 RepID=A0ABV6EEL4_9GAMM
MSLSLLGCDNADSEPEKARTKEWPQVSHAMAVHVYMPDWTHGELIYRSNPAEAEFQRLAMTKNEEGWWSAMVKADKLEFAFEGDSGIVNLGATQGCYSGSHYKCENEGDPAENFRSSAEQVWVKNGLLFTANPASDNAAESFTVLSVNLHTYQEFKTPGVKESDLTDSQAMERVNQHGVLFDRVAAAINQLNPDVVCLQEVGEWHGKQRDDLETVQFGATDSNMVRQILSRLDNKQYDFVMDWSHFGWDVWMEGSAVLSRHPIIKKDSRYISDVSNGTRTFWKSRNIPMAQIDLGSRLGQLDVFSIHAGWWNDDEEPFQGQFNRLTAWDKELKTQNVNTLFCGDFNQVAATKEQQFITNGTGYSEQYALANPDGLLDPTIGGTIDGWSGDVGKRIDFLVMNDDSPFEVRQSQRVFTQGAFGRVSDHTGVYAQFGLADRQPEQTEGSAPYQLYLVGSHTGKQTYRGNRFEHLEGGKYRLVTLLGAAQEDPQADFKAHRLYLTDRTGHLFSLGSPLAGKRLELFTPVTLVENSDEGFLFESEQAGLFQFDLDYDAKTLTVSQLD